MNRTHLLVERAFIYDAVNEFEDPKGCEYDVKVGAWLLREGREFLVKSDNQERPKTKKMDQETGEDQKGA